MSRYQIETTTPNGTPIIVPIPDGFLDQIRREYAHELAERIREEIENDSAWRPKWQVGMGDAADLIDPVA